MYYLLSSDTQKTTIPVSSTLWTDDCTSFIFEYKSATGVFERQKPAYVQEFSTIPPQLAITGATSNDCGFIKICRISHNSGFSVKVYIYMTQIKNRLDEGGQNFSYDGSHGWFLNSSEQSGYFTVYDWTIQTVAGSNISSQFPLVMTMSHDSTNIPSGGTNIKGLDWKPNAALKGNDLGWTVLANKSIISGLQNGTHNMVLSATTTYTTLMPGGNETRTVRRDLTWSFNVIDCTDSSNVKDPSPMLKTNTGANVTSPFNIYFPQSAPTTLVFQDYSVSTVGMGNTSCNYAFTSVTAEAKNSSGATVANLVTVSGALKTDIAFNQDVLANLLATSDTEVVNITFQVANIYSHQFSKQLQVKFISCAQQAARQTDLSYCINLQTNNDYLVTQLSNSVCDLHIKVMMSTNVPISKPWVSLVEGTTSIITIVNSAGQPIDSAEQGKYDLMRFVEYSPGKKFDVQYFSLYMCSYTAPANNGVAPGQTLTFDKLSDPSPSTFQMDRGQITSQAGCSLRFVTTNLASWMTWQDSQTLFGLSLNLTSSPRGTTQFGYQINFFQDANNQPMLSTFTISIIIVDACNPILPTNWVSLNGTFGTTFEQDVATSKTYALQQATVQGSTCGTLAYTFKATTDSGADWSVYLNTSDKTKVVVNYTGTALTVGKVTLEVTITLTNNASSLVKKLTINLYNCFKASGTVTPLADAQLEVGESRQFSMPVPQNYNNKCSTFQVLLYYKLGTNPWQLVSAVGTPSFVTAFTTVPNLDALLQGLRYTLSFNASQKGVYQMKFTVKNVKNVLQESTPFKVVVCQTTINYAVIQPQAVALTGQVFEFGRKAFKSDQNVRIEVSKQYTDPTNSQCTYSGTTLENVDAAYMTQTDGSNSVVIEVNSYPMTSDPVAVGYEIYRRDITVKVWHLPAEEVFFSNSPRFFTIRINDCFQNLQYSSTSWIQETPIYDPNIFQFEEATGPKTLAVKAPTPKYTGQCGAVSYSLVFKTSPSFASSQLTINRATGVITVETLADVYWGAEQVTIRVSNDFNYNESSFKIEIFDCQFTSISINAQDPVSPMISTGPDWSYTWKAFTTSFAPCTIDYSVACEEGKQNISSNLCSRGFQVNTSATTPKTAALRNVQINPLTILAQYDESGQISVDHEGEFTLIIKGFSSFNPFNFVTHSILVKITTPCTSTLNWIQPVTQIFLGDCATDGTNTFCDDIHYTIFTTQDNPITPYNHRFPYSCTPSYDILISQNGKVSPAPAFIQLLDSAKQPTTSYPAFLRVKSTSNADRDYDQVTLIIRATIGLLKGQTSYFMYVFNDCSPTHVPLSNTGQTLKTIFTVSQHLMQNPSYINTMSFQLPVAVNSSDKKYCVVTPQDYSLKQLNRPPAISGDFNSDLFSFSPDKTSNQITIHATSNRQVEVFLNGQKQCDLLQIDIDQCDIGFEIYAAAQLGKNGTYPLLATGTVTFKSECYLLKEYYDLRWKQKIDSWQWLQTGFTSYIIRDPTKTDKLPQLIPLLPSIDSSLSALESYSVKDLCGDFTYSIPGLASPFNLVVPSNLDPEPSLTCFSDDPEDADKAGPGFNRYFLIDLQVTLDRFSSLGPFKYNDVNRSSKLNYPIRDPCFGLSYTEAYITYNSGISTKVYNSTKLEVMQNSLWDTFLVTMPFQKYYTPEWGFEPKCGELNYTVSLNRTNQVLDWDGKTWLRLEEDGQKFIVIKVFAAKLGIQGLYHANYSSYIVTDATHKKANLYPTQTSVVKVTIADCYISSFGPVGSAPTEFLFQFFGPPKYFQFAEFKQTKACNYKSTYKMTAYELVNGQVPEYKENDLPDPNPIRFDPKNRWIEISTSNDALVNKTYQFYITGYLNNPTTFQLPVSYKWGPFNVFIQDPYIRILNSPPLMSNMQEKYAVDAGISQLVSIGSALDTEGDQVSLEEWTVSNNTITWVELDSTVDTENVQSLDFKISPPSNTVDSTFSINFRLRDNNEQSMSATFSTQIQVFAKKQSDFTFEGWQAAKSQAELPAKFEPPPHGIPQPISSVGSFGFAFDKPLNLTDLHDMHTWNSTNTGKDYFDFELIPCDQQFYEDNKDAYKFSWIVSSANETLIEFQLQFADYSTISQRCWDRVRFKILKPEAFVSLYSNKVTEFKSSVQTIPQQMRSKEELAQLTELKQKLDTVLKTLSASSSLNVLLSSSLQYLWGMINSMQVTVLTVLFNIKTPVNAQDIEIMILKLVSFDIFQTSNVLTKVFRFDTEKTPPLNYIFEKAGYESSNFILGMGPLFMAEFGYVMFFICLPILRHKCAQKNNRFAKWVRNVVPFQMIFRFYLEGTLELALNTLITFRKMDRKFWSQWQLCFSNLWAAMNLAFLVVMPILTLVITLKFNKRYHVDSAYKEKYDWMFEEIRGEHRNSALYHLFFICRRYIITICLVAMPSNTIFQIYLQTISSTVFFLYLIDTQPFSSSKQNKMELLNEFAVSISSYFLFLFTDYMTDNDMKYTCGWALCLHLVISIAINFAVVIFQSVSDIISKIKAWWQKRKRQNELLRMQERTFQAIIDQANNLEVSELNEDEQRRDIDQPANSFAFEDFIQMVGMYDEDDSNNRPIHFSTVDELRQTEQQQLEEPQADAPKENSSQELTNDNEAAGQVNKEISVELLKTASEQEIQIIQRINMHIQKMRAPMLEESKQIPVNVPQITTTKTNAERAIEALNSLSKINPKQLRSSDQPAQGKKSDYDIHCQQYPHLRKMISISSMGVKKVVQQPNVEGPKQHDSLEIFLKELSSQPSEFDDSSFFESSKKAKQELKASSKASQPEPNNQPPKEKISPYSVIEKLEAQKQQFSRDASTGRVREVFADIPRSHSHEFGKLKVQDGTYSNQNENN